MFVGIFPAVLFHVGLHNLWIFTSWCKFELTQNECHNTQVSLDFKIKTMKHSKLNLHYYGGKEEGGKRKLYTCPGLLTQKMGPGLIERFENLRLS